MGFGVISVENNRKYALALAAANWQLRYVVCANYLHTIQLTRISNILYNLRVSRQSSVESTVEARGYAGTRPGTA